MRTLFCITLVSVCWLMAHRCIAANEPKVIQLSNTEDLKDAANVNDAIDQLVNKVAECIQAKRAEPSQCYCLYPKEVAEFKQASETALKRHPDWKDSVVFYTQGGRSVNLSFEGVRRQLERKCQAAVQPPLPKP